MRPLSTRAFIVLIIVGFVVQAGLLATRGVADLRTFKVWALQGHENGLFAAYRRPPDEQFWVRPDYPPASLIFLEAAASVVTAMDAKVDATSRFFTVIVKAPMLLVRALLAIAVFIFVRRSGQLDAARRVALSLWLNPALMINGPVLGYLDTLCWTIGVAALLLAARGRNAWAGFAVALSALIKPQGLFFGAALGVMATGRPRNFFRIGGAAAFVIAAVLGPFIAASGWMAVFNGLRVNFTEGMLSAHALNAWWLVTACVRMWQYGLLETEAPMIVWDAAVQQIIGIDLQPWIAVAIIAAAIWIAWSVRHLWTITHLSAATALIVHTYFVFAVSVHENHLVYAVAPLALVALSRPEYRRILWAVTIFASVNMVLFYGFGRDFPRPIRAGFFLPVTAVLSAVSVALLVWHVRAFTRLRRESATTTDRAPTAPLVQPVR